MNTVQFSQGYRHTTGNVVKNEVFFFFEYSALYRMLLSIFLLHLFKYKSYSKCYLVVKFKSLINQSSLCKQVGNLYKRL